MSPLAHLRLPRFHPTDGSVWCGGEAGQHRLDTRTGRLVERINEVGGHRFEVPNHAVELPSGDLLVSDSGSPEAEGPGILLVRADGTATMSSSCPEPTSTMPAAQALVLERVL